MTLPCIINIGLRPTFGEHTAATTEIHIFDFDGDIYDQQLTVRFARFIRAEKKFENIAALTQQIAADCELARRQLADDSGVVAGRAGSLC